MCDICPGCTSFLVFFTHCMWTPPCYEHKDPRVISMSHLRSKHDATLSRAACDVNYIACAYLNLAILRSRAIFAVKTLPNTKDEVFIFGMYVREFGPEAPIPNRGRVHIESIDSTALYGKELPEERQHTLTAIVGGTPICICICMCCLCECACMR